MELLLGVAQPPSSSSGGDHAAAFAFTSNLKFTAKNRLINLNKEPLFVA
jgi:hypothetical protein